MFTSCRALRKGVRVNIFEDTGYRGSTEKEEVQRKGIKKGWLADWLKVDYEPRGGGAKTLWGNFALFRQVCACVCAWGLGFQSN